MSYDDLDNDPIWKKLLIILYIYFSIIIIIWIWALLITIIYWNFLSPMKRIICILLLSVGLFPSAISIILPIIVLIIVYTK